MSPDSKSCVSDLQFKIACLLFFMIPLFTTLWLLQYIDTETVPVKESPLFVSSHAFEPILGECHGEMQRAAVKGRNVCALLIPNKIAFDGIFMNGLLDQLETEGIFGCVRDPNDRDANDYQILVLSKPSIGRQR